MSEYDDGSLSVHVDEQPYHFWFASIGSGSLSSNVWCISETFVTSTTQRCTTLSESERMWDKDEKRGKRENVTNQNNALFMSLSVWSYLKIVPNY